LIIIINNININNSSSNSNKVPLNMGKGLNSITSMEDDNTTTDGIKPKAIMADPNTADILISDDGGT
jgi:hypothetical protein